MINAATATRDWAEQKSLQVFYSDSIDSTNSQAKRDGILSPTKPWLYVTASQTKGRGRGERTWTNTEAGHQLLSTWCFPLKQPPQPISVPLFGWAVYQALNDEFDANLSIKAPNDIWSEAGKLAGLLIESVSMADQHAIFIGLGLNVNESPTDVGPATNLKEAIGATVSAERWNSFLSHLLTRFAEVAQVCTAFELSQNYKSLLLEALQKWPQNQIEKLLSNGDLILKDSTRIPWNKL